MRINKEWVLGFIKAHRESSEQIIAASEAEIQKLKKGKHKSMFPGASTNALLIHALKAKIHQEEGYQRCLKDLEFCIIGVEDDKNATANSRS